MLNYLDDAPVVPGDERQPFAHVKEVDKVLRDAEQEIQLWQPNLEPVQTSTGTLGTYPVPTDESENVRSPTSAESERFEDMTTPHHPDDGSPPAVGSATGKRVVNEAVTS